ncbi:NEURL4 [Symbiodinium pilosum]|uniref:NEURL4 protein n=1 Tax=Symbiodinium pilosum TaxID=2952 RepID=A0A812WGM4_SYMPI|nr:NEURL4 [Symbiodinium pilosum]
MSALWAVPARAPAIQPTPVHVVHGVTTGVVIRQTMPQAPVPMPQAQSIQTPHIPVYAPMMGNPSPDIYGSNEAMYAPLSPDRIYAEHFRGEEGYAPRQFAAQAWQDVSNEFEYFDGDNDPQQEHFQLGDEAANVNGSWRTPWEDPDDSAEMQFLALLESLEARVDLMSQMQQTRAAIQQQATIRLDYDPDVDPNCDPEPEPGNLWDKIKDQDGHIYRLNEEVSGLRERLQGSLGSAAALHHAERVASVLQASSPVQTLSNDLHQAGPPYVPLKQSNEVLLPFCPQASGVNLEISEDGYKATRFRGCRQSVAVGTGPIPLQEHGRYFEITVEEIVAGWVGGLGIGVTSSTPQGLKRVPDKAWRIPKTMVIGYWGCVFVDGCEQRTPWRADSLQIGARVGFLVTLSGDLLVFVDGEAVVRVDGAFAPHELEPNPEPLYPVVDVFAATRIVSMSPSARPPPRSSWTSLHSPISAAAMRKAAANGTEQREA